MPATLPQPVALDRFDASFEVVAELSVAPGNLTFTPDRRLIFSLHQFYEPELRVVELTQDELTPFPNLTWHQPEIDPPKSLHSVLGIQCDANGIVWMLDNTLFTEMTPKLVGWDTCTNQLHRVIELPEPITTPGHFVNDLAVDLTHNAIYIADPAIAGPAALIVIDLETGQSRRVLADHPSVAPEDFDIVIDGVPLEGALPDGTLLGSPRTGVDAITLDAQDEWLYFAPMNSYSLYRIRTADLCNPHLNDAQLGDQVERYCDKPIICDGITIDQANNIYLGDLQAHALGVITCDRTYHQLIQDDRIAWLDSLSFSPDGWLYFVSNQLHRVAAMRGGVTTAQAPFHIFRMTPLAPGIAGR